METITWQFRHEQALNTLINLRTSFVKEYAEARERQQCVPEYYVYSLGELAARFGFSPQAFSRCCFKEAGKSPVELDVATALMSVAEHVRAANCYAGFKFHSLRTRRLMRNGIKRDPTTLVVRIRPVAARMGATVPEAMETVRRLSKAPVTKATVRRWCSKRRPLHVQDKHAYKQMLETIESLRDEREIEIGPIRKRFTKAFQV